jgi:hypothetical protein
MSTNHKAQGGRDSALRRKKNKKRETTKTVVNACVIGQRKVPLWTCQRPMPSFCLDAL